MRQKISGLAVIIMFLIALTACGQTFQNGSPVAAATNAQISVTGSGIVYVAPDVAYINVGVRSQGDTVAEALEINNTQAQDIKDTLVAAGVDAMDIQTSSFYVYPQSDYDYQGEVSRTYYSVENTVYVTVRELVNLSDILDAVARSGANNIYGIDFNVQDNTEAKSTARQLAIESAKTQAQELADAAGVELGDIVSISSSYSSPTTYYGYGIGGGGAEYAALDSSVPVTSGQIQVSTDVSMIYAIK